MLEEIKGTALANVINNRESSFLSGFSRLSVNLLGFTGKLNSLPGVGRVRKSFFVGVPEARTASPTFATMRLLQRFYSKLKDVSMCKITRARR
ncbi:hypothetical protein R1flu_016923 [Riccia fluitans]|uniref:Uncharacterized protein n=1 Tax=Riccia fluitans TaxID=41844 RepID=A0ABD1YN86_9MARC